MERGQQGQQGQQNRDWNTNSGDYGNCDYRISGNYDGDWGGHVPLEYDPTTMTEGGLHFHDLFGEGGLDFDAFLFGIEGEG